MIRLKTHSLRRVKNIKIKKKLSLVHNKNDPDTLGYTEYQFACARLPLYPPTLVKNKSMKMCIFVAVVGSITFIIILIH